MRFVTERQKKLKQVGLSDREAAIYEAALELGDSPALAISRRARIPRATTYLGLEALQDKGLIESKQEQNTTIFRALPPKKLQDLVNKKLRKIEQTKDVLADLIPQLQASSANRNDTTRLFSGLDELSKVHNQLVRMSTVKDVWYRLMPVDDLKNVLGDRNYLREKQLRAKKIPARVLFTTNSFELRDQILGSQTKQIQRKFIDKVTYSSSAGVTICRDRVLIEVIRNDEEISGIEIESEVIATLLREILKMIWIKY